MIKLTDILKEVGEASSKPYDYKIEHEDTNEIFYTFKTDSGLDYVINIEQLHPVRSSKDVKLSIAFRTVDGSYEEVTNRGEQFRIMATVVAAVKEYLAKVPNVTEIIFYPSKADQGDIRRANLYKAYIQKQIPGSAVKSYATGYHSIKLT